MTLAARAALATRRDILDETLEAELAVMGVSVMRQTLLPKYFALTMCLLATAATTSVTPAEALATRFAKLFTAGNAEAAAELFHYPPDHDDAERARDARDVAGILGKLTDRLGQPKRFDGPVRQPLAVYGLEARGGPNDYWNEISLVDATQWFFEIDLPLFGPAFVTATVFAPEGSRSPEIVKAGVALPTSGENSRETAIELTIEIVRSFDEQPPGNLRQIIEENVKPIEILPPSK